MYVKRVLSSSEVESATTAQYTSLVNGVLLFPEKNYASYPREVFYTDDDSCNIKLLTPQDWSLALEDTTAAGKQSLHVTISISADSTPLPGNAVANTTKAVGQYAKRKESQNKKKEALKGTKPLTELGFQKIDAAQFQSQRSALLQATSPPPEQPPRKKQKVKAQVSQFLLGLFLGSTLIFVFVFFLDLENGMPLSRPFGRG